MVRLRESHAMKITAVLLLLIFLILIPVSIIIEGELYYNVLEANLSSDTSYEDTMEFIDLYNKKIHQLGEYLKLKSILEDNGKLNYDKEVLSITGVKLEDKVTYTIGDLIKRSSFFVEDVTPIDDNTLQELFQNSFGYYVIYGENHIAEGIDWYSSEDFVQDFSKLEHAIVVEDLNAAQEYYETQWTPEKEGGTKLREDNADVEEASVYTQSIEESKMVDGNVVHIEPVLDRKNKEGMTVYLLDDISYCYTYYVSFYSYYQKLFNTGNSNFIYWLAVDSNMVATNLGEDSMGKDLYQSFYSPVIGELHYETAEYTILTDLLNIERYYIEDIENSLLGKGTNVRMHMGVLSEVPVNDAFSEGQHMYNLAQDLVIVFFIVGIIALIGIIVCSIFLILSAGCQSDTEEIVLTKFDHWYTEIGVVFCIGIAGISIYIVGGRIWKVNFYTTIDYIILGLEGLFLYFLFIFASASFIRRIKAHTILKNSLLINGGILLKHIFSKSCKILKQVYGGRKVTAKIVILFFNVVVASAILEFLAFFSDTEWRILCVLIYLILNGWVLWILLKGGMQSAKILEGAERIADGDLEYKIDVGGFKGANGRLVRAINRICDGLFKAVEQSVKDERMKTDLITNVSHDIKTPLTSIINYVDLLKREHIEDEKILSYIDVLDIKSQRLKNLTDDLVEASKLSSGTIVLTIEKIDLVELVNQTNGEFSEKFDIKNLTIVPVLPEKSIIVEADGRRLWRVLENLYNNVAKYAMENTRVYITVKEENEYVTFVMKNISANPLNINAEELTERFIRGDVSRSTEGSGLGLSIAKTLTELMQGTFEIYLDGDLFRITLTFPVKSEEIQTQREEIAAK